MLVKKNGTSLYQVDPNARIPQKHKKSRRGIKVHTKRPEWLDCCPQDVQLDQILSEIRKDSNKNN